MRFTDSYGEQSCTADRASFITGQSVFRTGLSKVGMPGSDVGLQPEDPTIAELVKPLGYATGQFGKNHLGDKNQFLPTVHGFDEFFGNLYHLNAEEDPESPDWPLVWFNTTHLHFRTHTNPESVGQAGRWQSRCHDTMIDHDKVVGALLDRLDALGIANNTIVVYSTDNGPHMNSWPDEAMTPFRSEKAPNGEGAFRVPEKLGAGHSVGGTTYRVHIDGYNFLPYLTGQAKKGPRPGFVYFSDDGDLVALRYDNFKLVFMEQRMPGTLMVWAEPFVVLRVPKMFNLRTVPFERADTTSNTYWDYLLEREYIALAAQPVIGMFLETFREFPPRQKAASFTIDQAMEKLESAVTANR